MPALMATASFALRHHSAAVRGLTPISDASATVRGARSGSMRTTYRLEKTASSTPGWSGFHEPAINIRIRLRRNTIGLLTLAENLAAHLAPRFRSLHQHQACLRGEPLRHGDLAQLGAGDVVDRQPVAPRAREALREAADARGVDDRGGGDGALGVALRVVEPADRRGHTMELRLADPCRERRAREIADLLEPVAEAVEEEEELELGIVALGVKLPGYARDPLDVVHARDAVEILVERTEIGGDGIHRRLSTRANSKMPSASRARRRRARRTHRARRGPGRRARGSRRRASRPGRRGGSA